MLFVIRYFPEITVKSKIVRKQMVRRLKDNLYSVLRPLDSNVRIFSQWDKLTVETTLKDVDALANFREVLVNTPGITHILQVEQCEVASMEDIACQTLEAFAHTVRDRRFVVRCKRTGEHGFNSHEIERHVGGYLLHHVPGSCVDLHQPEVTVRIELHQNTLHLVRLRLEGLGGFPLGAIEPALSLISGGFDSPVASYQTMRRGMPTHFCFFNLGGREHELGVKQVAWHLWQRYAASHRVQFVTVPFEAVVAEILENVDNSQMGVVLKRMMLRAASRVADKLDKNIQALVTGEAVAQVSSQTLTNLAVIDEACDKLVLRPLITWDKEAIVQQARQIGTATFAASMPEYCGVISVNPTTRARQYRVEAEERKFDMSRLDEAVAAARYCAMDELVLEGSSTVEIETSAVPLPGALIVDIRHPDEQQRKPLSVAGQTVEAVPFYRLQAYMQSHADQFCLLYCDKGVMSRLHAAHLMEQGCRVGVYRPHE